VPLYDKSENKANRKKKTFQSEHALNYIYHRVRVVLVWHKRELIRDRNNDRTPNQMYPEVLAFGFPSHTALEPQGIPM